MAVREDAWLSERFGHPVWSIDPGDDPPRGGMVQARLVANDVAGVRVLCAAGLYLVDAALTLVRKPGPVELEGEVVEARPEHREAVLAIASSAFRFSRFHLDPAIPDATANRVKHDWMESYFEGTRGDGLLVALDGDRPVGFLGLIDTPERSVIDLVAADPARRGRGIGRSLVAAFVARGGERLEVGTQAANLPSLALYESMGFRVGRAAYNLHGHTF